MAEPPSSSSPPKAAPAPEPAPPRLIDASGRPTIRTIGLETAGLRDLYHFLLRAPWWQVLGLIVATYLLVNVIFAEVYLAVGGIDNARPASFADHFFFSVQTLATIGYGQMAPASLGAHLVVTLESLTGILGVALFTGLLFAKFSRPSASVLFSRVAVVSDYEGVPSLMFRMANRRSSLIVEARLRVSMLSSEVTAEGSPIRRMRDLTLLRSESASFLLSWLAIHPIDEHSPLFGLTPRKLRDLQVSIGASLVGIDETYAQTVHARHAYAPYEVRYGARFTDIFLTDEKGEPFLDFTGFHEFVDVSPTESALGTPHPGE